MNLNLPQIQTRFVSHASSTTWTAWLNKIGRILGLLPTEHEQLGMSRIQVDVCKSFVGNSVQTLLNDDGKLAGLRLHLTDLSYPIKGKDNEHQNFLFEAFVNLLPAILEDEETTAEFKKRINTAFIYSTCLPIQPNSWESTVEQLLLVDRVSLLMCPGKTEKPITGIRFGYRDTLGKLRTVYASLDGTVNNTEWLLQNKITVIAGPKELVVHSLEFYNSLLEDPTTYVLINSSVTVGIND